MNSAAKTTEADVAQRLAKIRNEIDEVLETLEVTGDKKLMQEIREGLRQAKQGKGVPIEKLLEKIEKG
ncbi:MAG: hypothetical protein U9M97_01985 [Candidatus Hadarchaeota archaeon]|nr:hypothetical protein [Candidatus Hadarchaeota archaeon]